MTNYTKLRQDQSIIVINNMLNDLFDNFNETIRTNNLELTSAYGMYQLNFIFSIGKLRVSSIKIKHKGKRIYEDQPNELEIIEKKLKEFIKLKMKQQ